MIRQAAAYATAAGIGSVVGTFVGTIFGVALMSVIYADKLKVVVNSNGLEQESLINGRN